MTNVPHVLTDAEFAVLLETGPDALVVTDVHGSVLLVNAQTTELFGYDQEELVGKDVEALIPERYRSLNGSPPANVRIAQRRKRVLGGNQPHSLPERQSDVGIRRDP